MFSNGKSDSKFKKLVIKLNVIWDFVNWLLKRPRNLNLRICFIQDDTGFFLEDTKDVKLIVGLTSLSTSKTQCLSSSSESKTQHLGMEPPLSVSIASVGTETSTAETWLSSPHFRWRQFYSACWPLDFNSLLCKQSFLPPHLWWRQSVFGCQVQCWG